MLAEEFDQNNTIIDLFDFDGNKSIVASNFDTGSGTLYEVEDHKLKQVKDFELPNGSGQCHGSCFYDADTIGLSTNKHYLFFIDKVSGEIIVQYNLPYHIKDMCTISPGEMMLYFAINSLSAQQEPTYASGLLHISLNFEVKSLTIKNKKFFRPAAFEAIFLDKNSATFYIPDQFGGRVILVRLQRQRRIMKHGASSANHQSSFPQGG